MKENVIPTKPFNRDAIKYFAAFAMLLNHIAVIFLEPGTALYFVFTYIGYFTAITMCFFLVEGYDYTRSKRKYAARLLIFAVISQMPYYLAFRDFQLNMLFTLFFCFLILYVKENVIIPEKRTAFILLLVFVTVFCDWSLFAAVFTLFFSECRENGGWNKKNLMKYYGISAVVFACFNFNPARPILQALVLAALSSTGIVLSGIVVIHYYNGERAAHGRTFSKYFFYLFYPVHLICLVLIRTYLAVS